MKLSDKEYEDQIDKLAHYLCGLSCGTAVDVIINYCKRPDLSNAQFCRLVDELVKLKNGS